MQDQPAELPDEPARSSSEGLDSDLPAIQRPRLRRRGRAEVRDRETIKQLIRDLPKFVKLLWGLYRDPRVSTFDKALVAATIAYIVVPLDLVPDFIPVLGQVDDIYLLALSLDRLLNNAGVDVLLEHWDGEVASLEMAITALDRAGSFLPEQVRALLKQRVK